jgi:hypothetical protein
MPRERQTLSGVRILGDVLGAVIGGAGSYLAGQSAKSNALTGYSYLAGKNGTPGPGSDYVNRGQVAAGQQTDTQNLESGLLTSGANTPQAQSAFGNYLNSTGYKFAQQQGTQAITGSAAARGILNSGATAKALTSYGQNSAKQGFDNYLGNLSNLNTQQGAVAGQGLDAAKAIGAAGTQGGIQAGNAMQSGISNAGGLLAGGTSQGFTNFFGGGDLSPVAVTPNVFGSYSR